MLVKDLPDNHNYTNVFKFNTPFRKKNIFNRIMTRLGFPITSDQRIWKYTHNRNGKFERISFPFSDYDITISKEYDEADIINLHWVGNFIDYKSFFKKNKKIVVWTLRDSYPFQGIFHLQNDLERNGEYWKRLNNEMIRYKTKCLAQIKSPIEIVGISNFIKEKSKTSELLRRFEHHVIYNCIDHNEFKRIDKSIARELLNIDKKLIVFCFVADSINRFNKGFSELKVAIEMLLCRNILFLSVGEGTAANFKISVKHRHLGKLNSNDLNLVYAASNAFIFPTKEEALGNVMLEAMACGTPVIGTPIGGIPEVIRTGFNGLLSKNTSSEGLKNAMENFITTRESYHADEITNFISKNFNENKISSEYVQLYENLIKSNNQEKSNFH